MSCGALAGLALSALGTGASEYANVATKNKMNDVTNQELSKQQQFSKQAQNQVNQSIQQSGAPQALQNQQAGVAQALAAAKGARLPALTVPQLGQQQGDAVSYVGQDAKNQLAQNSNAQLQGYNNIGLQNQLNNQQVQNQLGMITGNSRDWANALPLQLQQASQSQSGLAALGSLLGSAGSVVGLSGLGSAPGQASQWGQGFGALQGMKGLPLTGLQGFDPQSAYAGWN